MTGKSAVVLMRRIFPNLLTQAIDVSAQLSYCRR